MPKHALIPREGFTAEVVATILKKTALNPAFTLMLILLGRYTKRGSDLSILHARVYARIRNLFCIGVLRWLSNYLSDGVANNWTSDKYDWNQEVVLVTGGAGGIGGLVVRMLAEKGVKVVVLDIIPMTFSASKNVYYYKCDITSPSEINTTAQAIRTTIGNPTVLILNAGIARGKTVLSVTPADLSLTFSVNTFAHYYLAQAFLPSMIANNHGIVMTVASLAAYAVMPNMVDYASSKSAALSFHEGLRTELKVRYSADKVRTILVTQGHTKTPLFEGWENNSGFLIPSLEVESVAEGIVDAVFEARSGQVILPWGGRGAPWLRVLPSWYHDHVRSKGEGLMKRWKGRQVVEDVAVWAEKRDRGDAGRREELVTEESGSTVLVPTPIEDA